MKKTMEKMVKPGAVERESAINDELRRIYDEYKALKPSVVVAEAKEKTSPLHNAFEWSDGKAGHEYRLSQARRLIRVSVIVIVGDGGDKRERYIHVPAVRADGDKAAGDEGEYHPISVVVQNPDSFARALSELAGKVRAAQAAAEELRSAAQSMDNPDGERMARIAMAITALQTAGAAVNALH